MLIFPLFVEHFFLPELLFRIVQFLVSIFSGHCLNLLSNLLQRLDELVEFQWQMTIAALLEDRYDLIFLNFELFFQLEVLSEEDEGA